MFTLLIAPAFLFCQDYLSVCTIFKDNADYFKEWIEFHRLVGVDHFYLYNNSSSDNFHEILDPYISQGIVTLIEWPNIDEHKWRSGYTWVQTTQTPAYRHCCKISAGRTKWLAVIDTDEFIVPKNSESIVHILRKLENAPGVFVWWRVFGTSGVYDVPPNELMIELLTMRFPDDSPHNHQGKVIVQPEQVLDFTWAGHQCSYLSNAKVYIAPTSQMQINHYANRTIKFFYEHKIKQKETMDHKKWPEKQILKLLNEGNEIEDSSMTPFILSLKQRLGFYEASLNKCSHEEYE